MQRYRVEVFAPRYGVSCTYSNADSHKQALAERLTKAPRGLPAARRGHAVVVPVHWDADHWCEGEPVAFFKWALAEGGPTIKPTCDQRVLGHRHARKYAGRPVRVGRDRPTRLRLALHKS